MSQISVMKLKKEPIFMHLNIGNQIYNFQRSQFFFQSENWVLDLKFSNKTNLLKIEEPDFFVLKFETGTLFSVRLNTGSQIFKGDIFTKIGLAIGEEAYFLCV